MWATRSINFFKYKSWRITTFVNCNITYFISLHVELFFWTWCIILIRALQAIECMAAHLKEKQCLDRLYLNWIGEDIDEASVSCDEMSLEVLQPYINLKALRLNCYGEWDFHFGLCCSKILSNLNYIYVKIANIYHQSLLLLLRLLLLRLLLLLQLLPLSPN